MPAKHTTTDLALLRSAFDRWCDAGMIQPHPYNVGGDVDEFGDPVENEADGFGPYYDDLDQEDSIDDDDDEEVVQPPAPQ